MSEQTPANLTLTPEQESVAQALISFLENDTETSIILQGHAGTGKTTLIDEVRKRYQTIHDLQKIINPNELVPLWEFTALTRKACIALSEKISTKVATTIHSFLSLRPTSKGLKKSESHYYEYKYPPNVIKPIIVVDECSFIDYDLLGYLQEFSDANPQAKFIFMGDKYQLNPVGLNHSPIYTLGIRELTLTQVVRQAPSSLIHKFSEMFRTMVTTGELKPLLHDGVDVQLLPMKAWKQKMLDVFSNSLNNKVIRLSNAKVHQSNKFLFENINKRAEYQVGDMLINNTYVGRVPADTTLIIKSLQTSNFYGDLAYVADFYVMNSDMQQQNVVTFVLPRQPNLFSTVYSKVLIDTGYQKRVLADVIDARPAYACTVHKSQGSTYDSVFINLTDFKNMYYKDPKEFARLLYVAFSRAKHTVYLTGDII